jgi:broad specificity phosphatase PhoE
MGNHDENTRSDASRAADLQSGRTATQHGAVLRCIASRLHSLSLDELRVLDVITTRMVAIGRDTYGPLDLSRETRDWKAEQAAEYADSIFYGACHEVAANDARLERLRCEAADEIAGRIEPGLRELAENAPDQIDQRFDVGGEG